MSLKLIIQIEEDGLLVNEDFTVAECSDEALLQALQDKIGELMVGLYPPSTMIRQEKMLLCNNIADLMKQVHALYEKEEEEESA